MDGFRSSLARRLRIALVLVGVILTLQIVAASLVMTKMSRTFDATVSQLVPLTTAVEELTTGIGELSALVLTFEDLRTEGEIEIARRAVVDRVEALSVSASQLTDPYAVGIPAQQLRYAIFKLRTAAERALDNRLRLIEAEGGIDAAASRIDSALDELVAAVEPLQFPAQGGPATGGPRSAREERAAADLIVKTYGLIDAVHSLMGRSHPGGIEADTTRIVQRLLDVSTALSRRPDDEERRDIADRILLLRTALTGEGGLADMLSSRAALAETALEHETRIAEIASEIAARQATNIEMSVRNVGRRTEELRSQMARMRMGEVVFGVAFTIVIIAIMSWLFERHVIRRIRALAHDVRRIANGRTDLALTVGEPDEIGDMEAALVTFQDNARALRQSNADLQSFAYAASHDMRTPLRAISDLVEWTIEDHGDDLPEAARTNLDLVRSRARRLTALVRGMLDYARADIEVETGWFDVEAYAVEMSDLLDPGGRFDIRASGAPGFDIALAPIRTIMLNLVSNAIKHHDRPEGTVAIHVEAMPEGVRIEVSDDGPGIAPDYHDKVFALFQTLRSRDEVEGSGLGLSLVRKLVSRLGGTVEIVSDPPAARGTSFVIHLPAAPVLAAA